VKERQEIPYRLFRWGDDKGELGLIFGRILNWTCRDVYRQSRNQESQRAEEAGKPHAWRRAGADTCRRLNNDAKPTNHSPGNRLDQSGRRHVQGATGFSTGGSMKVTDILRRIVGNIDSAAESLLRVNDKLDALVAGCANETDLINRKLDQVVAGLDERSALLNRRFNQVIAGLDNIRPSAKQASPASPRQAIEQRPLLMAERTYNSSHPDYDARVVRNFPGHFFNREKPCENAAFRALGLLAEGDDIPDHTWPPVFGANLVEAASVPYAAQVFERRSYVKQYLAELNRKYHAYYLPGWVNLDDALFLYWLVRQVKPGTIVQTGVCNGLSTALMILGLVKNGSAGRLHAIDLPAVFDAQDPAWTVEGNVYDYVIPEGRTSGWLVPDAYRERFELWTGNATELLPKMIDKLPSIGLFYHDSDHSYNHMMFEFHQAKRKLGEGSLVVGDDVSWNASLWDFADEFAVPAYNFRGTMGVAFF
jgi:Methyltransferase domain